MDGRTDGRMDGWMDRRTDGQTDGWMDGRTDGRMDEWRKEGRKDEITLHKFIKTNGYTACTKYILQRNGYD